MNTTRREKIMSVIAHRQSGLIVILEDIHDPHNAAAILRTCDALGIQTVCFIFEHETPYNPKRVGKSSSSSANKWLDFRTFTSTKECLTSLKADGYTIVATALSDIAAPLTEASWPEDNIALIIGNEHRGISETAQSMADRSVVIPMRGFVQSLNVSVATAIVLWEIVRQRGDTKIITGNTREILIERLLERGKK